MYMHIPETGNSELPGAVDFGFRVYPLVAEIPDTPVANADIASGQDLARFGINDRHVGDGKVVSRIAVTRRQQNSDDD